MKIYILAPNENWICDRLNREWAEHQGHTLANDYRDADILWLLGSWCWNQLPIEVLENKKVITTVHHIVPEKFSREKQYDFYLRDQITDAYHVPSLKTKNQISQITEKQIFCYPFWVNQSLWFDIEEKQSIRKKYGLKKDDFVIGSFQRDTEGHDLLSPKLEKGPDLFCDMVENLFKDNKKIKILLAGWRRQYVINRLKKAKIPHIYYELPDFATLNELYNCLDLYLVTSRYEGGPQSILECAASKTPIVSTDVGVASEILSNSSIFQEKKSASPNTQEAYNNVEKLLIPNGFENFIKMFELIYEK